MVMSSPLAGMCVGHRSGNNSYFFYLALNKEYYFDEGGGGLFDARGVENNKSIKLTQLL